MVASGRNCHICIVISSIHCFIWSFACHVSKGRALDVYGRSPLLLYPISKGRPKNKIDIWDWCFAILLAIGCLNILINWDAISQREGMPTSSDIYLGVMMIILVIEGARRSMGWPLPIVAIVTLIYALSVPISLGF